MALKVKSYGIVSKSPCVEIKVKKAYLTLMSDGEIFLL